MSNRTPYDHTDREGLPPISWETFHGLCKGLALAEQDIPPDDSLLIEAAEVPVAKTPPEDT